VWWRKCTVFSGSAPPSSARVPKESALCRFLSFFFGDVPGEKSNKRRCVSSFLRKKQRGLSPLAFSVEKRMQTPKELLARVLEWMIHAYGSLFW